MIKIRYSDLPGGQHVRVGVQGRNTILYLLPGLSAVQRKAAIRRARSAARVGHGPALPAPGVARALAADRVRTTVRNGLAAMRMHPAIFFPPMVIIVAVAVAYLVLVSVSFRLIPHASEPNVVFGASGGHQALRPTARPGDPPASGSAPGSSRSPSGPRGRGPGRSASPHPGSSRSASPSSSPSRQPSSPGRPGTPSPVPSASSPSTPAPGPSAAPSPASTSPGPGSGSGSTGVCVQVGPLGVCVGL